MRIVTLFSLMVMVILMSTVFSVNSAFQVTRPLNWSLTYTSPGTPVTINWTASVSSFANPMTYTTQIFTNAGVFVTTLTVDTPNTYDTWVATGAANGFYYANVTACDLLAVVCSYNISSVFGVYTPTITVGFGPSAATGGADISTANFTEYCQHLFYPAGTQFETGADLLTNPGGTLSMEVYDSSPAVSAANRAYLFPSVAPGAFRRVCYGINIYNSTGIGPTRDIILTPPPAPPPSGTSTTTVPVNTAETIGIIVLLILLIFISTILSDIKVLGVVGAVLMLLLGLWISMAGIYYKSGEVNTGKNTVVSIYSNTTNLTVKSTYTNNTIVNTYDIIQVPLVNIIGVSNATANTLLGLVVVLLGMFAMIYYSRIFTKWH